jgi:hypothetical protein
MAIPSFNSDKYAIGHQNPASSSTAMGINNEPSSPTTALDAASLDPKDDERRAPKRKAMAKDTTGKCFIVQR